MILNEDSEPEKVVNYLSGLKESVEKMQTEAARINKYQILFKVCAWGNHGAGKTMLCVVPSLRLIHFFGPDVPSATLVHVLHSLIWLLCSLPVLAAWRV